MKQKRMVILLMSLVAILLVACGGSAPGETAPAENSTIEVVTYDIYFGEDPNNAENPPVWTVEAGSVATVVFDNRGSLEHNWAVVKPGTEIPVPFDLNNDSDLILYDTGVVQPGTQMSFPFQVPDEPGEYIVICTVAGHYPGMQGRLVVN